MNLSFIFLKGLQISAFPFIQCFGYPGVGKFDVSAKAVCFGKGVLLQFALAIWNEGLNRINGLVQDAVPISVYPTSNQVLSSTVILLGYGPIYTGNIMLELAINEKLSGKILPHLIVGLSEGANFWASLTLFDEGYHLGSMIQDTIRHGVKSYLMSVAFSGYPAPSLPVKILATTIFSMISAAAGVTTKYALNLNLNKEESFSYKICERTIYTPINKNLYTLSPVFGVDKMGDIFFGNKDDFWNLLTEIVIVESFHAAIFEGRTMAWCQKLHQNETLTLNNTDDTDL